MCFYSKTGFKNRFVFFEWEVFIPSKLYAISWSLKFFTWYSMKIHPSIFEDPCRTLCLFITVLARILFKLSDMSGVNRGRFLVESSTLL